MDEEGGELFDLEPDNNSGEEDIAALPNVFVIFITTYDPFGAERMVYTIKTGCMEMPELPYEDGARTIFF